MREYSRESFHYYNNIYDSGSPSQTTVWGFGTTSVVLCHTLELGTCGNKLCYINHGYDQ